MIVKATITHLPTLEKLSVQWNPTSYSIRRTNLFASPALPGMGLSPLGMSTGGAEWFTTRLFLDSSDSAGAQGDLRSRVERLESWAETEQGRDLPPTLLFVWGAFRFQGVIEDFRQEWVRFDPDGAPIRGWVELTLRRSPS